MRKRNKEHISETERWLRTLEERPATAPVPERIPDSFPEPEIKEGRLAPPLIPGGEEERWTTSSSLSENYPDIPLPPLPRLTLPPIEERFYRWHVPEENPNAQGDR